MKRLSVNRKLLSAMKELRLQRALKAPTTPTTRYDYSLITLTLKWNGAN